MPQILGVLWFDVRRANPEFSMNFYPVEEQTRNEKQGSVLMVHKPRAADNCAEGRKRVGVRGERAGHGYNFDYSAIESTTTKTRNSLKDLAGPTRLELATSCVTGRRSNRLNYGPALMSAGGGQ
jgi:hypothetical protein